MVEFRMLAPEKYNLLWPMIFESGKKLGFFTEDGRLSKFVSKKLYEKDGAVWLEPFWCESVCGNGGFDKKEFVNFQVLAYSAKELWDKKEIAVGIKYNGQDMRPLIGPNKQRKGDDIIKKIKLSKENWNIRFRMHRIKMTARCKARGAHREPGWIPLCCVCFAKPMKIAEKVLDK